MYNYVLYNNHCTAQMAEHGQNSSKDSRHFFLERSKDFKEKVKKVAPQVCSVIHKGDVHTLTSL